MNKRRPIQEVFYTIMRITFTQILIMILLTSLVSAAHLDTKGQGILDRKVSLNVENEEIKDVLAEIQRQTSVVFTYRYKFIKSLGKVNLSVTDATLKDVLQLLFDSNISMLVVNEEEEIGIKPRFDTETDSALPKSKCIRNGD